MKKIILGLVLLSSLLFSNEINIGLLNKKIKEVSKELIIKPVVATQNFKLNSSQMILDNLIKNYNVSALKSKELRNYYEQFVDKLMNDTRVLIIKNINIKDIDTNVKDDKFSSIISITFKGREHKNIKLSLEESYSTTLNLEGIYHQQKDEKITIRFTKIDLSDYIRVDMQ